MISDSKITKGTNDSYTMGSSFNVYPMIYPFIDLEFNFNMLEILQMNRPIISNGKKNDTQNILLNFYPENGVYILRICNDQFIASSIFTV